MNPRLRIEPITCPQALWRSRKIIADVTRDKNASFFCNKIKDVFSSVFLDLKLRDWVQFPLPIKLTFTGIRVLANAKIPNSRASLSGTQEGGVINQLLANLFLNVEFDKWMEKQHPLIT